MIIPKQQKMCFGIDTPSAWVEKELGTIELGDERLNRRAKDVLTKMSHHPTGSIPLNCNEWSDTKGTYALFKNKKVTGEKMIAPHQRETWERVKAHECVLALQDTTLLDYTHYETTTGLGSIGTKKQNIRGMLMHNTIAVTTEGLPLGTLRQDIWVRPEKGEEGKNEGEEGAKKDNRPIEEKESYRWIHAMKAVQAAAPAGTKVISVSDAESDIYELFVAAEQYGAQYVTRAAQKERCLLDPTAEKLRSAVLSNDPVAQMGIDVSAKDGTPARKATVSVRYRRVKIKPPYRSSNTPKLPPIYTTAILVKEINPPAGCTPVEWLLLTNVPVRATEDALQCIGYYCLRWQVEIFHKILKSGCRVEHRRLKSADRLRPCIALLSIIAWRIHWMTHLLRTQPDAPCSTVLADSEWRALYTLATRLTEPPPTIPTIEQAILWIAQLGGFLARKRDGQPGVTVIWRGWQRLQDAVAIWQILHPPTPQKDMGKT